MTAETDRQRTIFTKNIKSFCIGSMDQTERVFYVTIKLLFNMK